MSEDGEGGGGAEVSPPRGPQTMIVPNLSAPSPFDIDGPGAKERWNEWRESWNRYTLLSGVDKQPNDFQAALLIHSIGTEARRIHAGMSFAPGEENDPRVILNKYDEYFMGKSLEHIERMKFYSRNQQLGENFEQYLSELRNMAKPCGFCNCMSDKLVMDRIMLGHKDEKTKDKLSSIEKPTLSSVIAMCRAMEVTSQNMKVLKQQETISRVAHKETKLPGRRWIDKCKFCARAHEGDREKCPAFGRKCRTCGERNHFAEAELCSGAKVKYSSRTQPNRGRFRGKKTHLVRAVVDDEDDYSTEGSVYAVTIAAVSDPANRPLYCKMVIDDNVVTHQIDPGATVCVIPKKFVGSRPIRPDAVTLKMWNGDIVHALGRCKIKARNKRTSQKWNIDYVVVDNKQLVPLLSRKAAETMNLITVNYHNFEDINAITTNSGSKWKEEFPECFDGNLGTLPGGPVRLRLKPDADPVIRPARTLPEAIKEKVRVELDEMVRRGILAKVDIPTDWVNQMAVTEKKSGKIRICIDPKHLNDCLKREHYRLPTMDDILPAIQGSKWFSVADLKEGYWHCELDEESSLLTTMATPFGRYRWRRLPFGLNVSAEIFQKRLHQSLEGLAQAHCIADDILVLGKEKLDNEANMRNVLQRASKTGMKFNLEKLQECKTSVEFYGHIFSDQGLKPDPGKVRAIEGMPAPSNVDEVDRLKGLVGYLSRFMPNLSTVMSPITELTRAGVAWTWDAVHDEALKKVKELICKAPALAYFDPGKQLEIQSDASGQGLGAALLQEGRPIAYHSRALRDAETRYSTIEKEMLALVVALEKWHQFTYGRKIIAFSDHKPLQAIIKKPLDRAPKRLQGMLIRAMAYDVEIRYLEGKKMLLADALSRAYLPICKGESCEEFEKVNALDYLPMQKGRITQAQEETNADPVLIMLKDIIQRGWPEKHLVPPDVMQYYHVRDELAISNGLIFRGARLVIPVGMRKVIMKDVHRGHSGIDGSLRLARDYVYWPGMTNGIRDMVRNCEACREQETMHTKEPLLQPHMPERPWQVVGTDLLLWNGKDYMVTVDYFSNFWEIDRLYDTSSKAVMRRLKTHFARYGFPEELVTDSGSQFTSDQFKEFARRYDFKHTKATPHHHQANGKAEAAVKAAKRLLSKTYRNGEDPYVALAIQRNTPQQGIGLSPVQRLLGRRTRTVLPITMELLEMKDNTNTAVEGLRANRARQKYHWDKSAQELPELKEGDTVRVKPYKLGDKIWKKATIHEKVDGRSYNVQTENGQVLRRIRNQLRLSQEAPLRPKDIPCCHTTQDDAAKDMVETEGKTPPNHNEGDSITQTTPGQGDQGQETRTQDPREQIENNSACDTNKTSMRSGREQVTRTRCGRAVRKPAKYSSFTE